MNKSKRPPTRIDLGDSGRTALRAVLDDYLHDADIDLSELKMRLFVDHLEDFAGRLFYNTAVEDCASAAGQTVARLQDDLDLLRKI